MSCCGKIGTKKNITTELQPDKGIYPVYSLTKKPPLFILLLKNEVSEKAQNGGWGKSVVEELSNHITANFGDMRGFSPQNIWRMKQFYETYKDSQILSALLRELSWTNNLLVMSRAKTDEERLFYIRLSIDEKYSSRETARQKTFAKQTP